MTTTPPSQQQSFAFLRSDFVSFLISGGVAGATSRTVVSPLERLKIIQQVQSANSAHYQGVWSSLVRMWQQEGVAGLFRGNGINCLRITPYSAVQFTVYEQAKQVLTFNGSRPLDSLTRTSAGAIAGIVSVCTTYPLDLVRSRLSIATASLPSSQPLPTCSTKATTTLPTTSAKPRLHSAYHTSAIAFSSATLPHATTTTTTSPPVYTPSELTIMGMTRKIVLEEGGVRALYRGLVTTAAGVAPYVGINFATFEYLRDWFIPPGGDTDGLTVAIRKLSCGAVAGSISQTLTYPFDVLRRKMQVAGMRCGPSERYTGAVDALRSVVRKEGVKGLYRGLWPNLLKVAPSMATSFYSYELVKEYLIPP